uniref:NR LBD domain-containing protein n=1 Tax=Panagrolaimus davidi TaxID=227884 RepID=A0A914Q9F6_9BILA
MSLTLFNHQKPNANEILEQKITDLKEPEFLLENSENELSLSPIAFVARFLRLIPRKLLILIEHFSTYKNSVFSIVAYCIPSGIGKYMKVNAEVFRNEYLKLDDMDKQVFENISYYNNMLITLFNGVTPARLKHCSRFYAAMMILRLFQDKMKDVQCAEMFDVQKEVLRDICKNVCLELKRLKKAAAYLQEMAALRKPVSDLLGFLEKYSKDF